MCKCFVSVEVVDKVLGVHNDQESLHIGRIPGTVMGIEHPK